VSRTGTTTRDRGSSRRSSRRGTPARVTPLRTSRHLVRHRRALLLLAGLLVLGLLGWGIWSGPLLAVRSVQVDGATTLSADLVREAAGIEVGRSLLRVDVDAAREAVAELPQVESVAVTRGWPSRVVVTLVERTPLAVVGEPGRRSLLDERGVLFDTVTGEPPAGVVPLAVDDPGPDDEATAAALAAIGALPEPVRAQVALVTAEDPEQVELTLVDGPLVLWGGGDDSSTKAEILDALLAQLAAGTLEPADELDISVPTAVVVR
jgi:cell division protein FtsQ